MATFKLLLLGTGGSGKTTLFKQFMAIYHAGLTEAKRMGMVGDIHKAIIKSMQALILASDTSALDKDDYESILKFDTTRPVTITLDTASQLERLWLSEPIQKTYQSRVHHGLDMSMAHFFENLDQIAVSTYVPSEHDVICLPEPSPIVCDVEFVADGFNFSLVDVGGNRNDRKKWPHCFEGVQGVMYVVSLADFDLLVEDAAPAPKQNDRRSLRLNKSYSTNLNNILLDSLATFHDVCRASALRHAAMFLVFNKVDVFRAKLKAGSGICSTFPQYTGPNEFSPSYEFIRSEFLAAASPRHVGVFCIQATTTTSVQDMVEIVLDITMQTNLKNSGFM